MASADLDPDRQRRLSATVVATLAHDLQNLLTLIGAGVDAIRGTVRLERRLTRRWRSSTARLMARTAFDPFFTTRPGRTGLGLTSAAITVGRLGGWLRLQDNGSHGTKAEVYLPLL